MWPTGLLAEWVGAALLVRRGDPDPWTVGVARVLPAEPGRTPVVVDAEAVRTGNWGELAELLADLPGEWRASLRLVLSWAGCVADAAPARILADRLRADVIAPDGRLLLSTAGTLFVGRPQGGGGWRRFAPGRPPVWVGLRYPTPGWERYLPPQPLHSRTGMVAEPVPAGLWVRQAADESRFSDRLDDPAFAVPPDPLRVAVVVGGPAGSGVHDGELAEIIGALPPVARDTVALLPYARLTAGATRTPVRSPHTEAPVPATATRSETALPTHPARASVPEPTAHPAAVVPPVAPAVVSPVAAAGSSVASAVPPVAAVVPPAAAVVPPVAPAVVSPVVAAGSSVVPPAAAPRVSVVVAPRTPPLVEVPLGRSIEGGVVFDPDEQRLEPSDLAPWWSPDPDLFAVLVGYDAESARFRIGTQFVDGLRLAEAVAALPKRDARPVLLVTDDLPPGWVVQIIADALQVATVAGPQQQGRWWAALPRRTGAVGAPVRDMGTAYPFRPADSEALSGPPPKGRRAPTRRRSRLAPQAGDRRGVLLSGPGDPSYPTLRARLSAWGRKHRGTGTFGVAVGVNGSEQSAPFRVGGRPATGWDVASALADAGELWAAAGEIVLLADPPGRMPDRQAQLLANYLRRSVLIVDTPLWTSDVDNVAGEMELRCRPGGRVLPVAALAAGGGWVRVDPVRSGGPGAVPDGPLAVSPVEAGKRRIGPAAGRSEPPPEPGDPRLARILAGSQPMPAGRRFEPTGDRDERVRRLHRRLLEYPDRYLVTMGADRSGYRVGDEPLTPADLAALLDACPDRAGRPVLLVADRGGEPAVLQRTADRLGAPILATRGPAFASPDGLLLVEGAVYRHAPADDPARAVPVGPPGIRFVRLRWRLIRRRGTPRSQAAAQPVALASMVAASASAPPPSSPPPSSPRGSALPGSLLPNSPLPSSGLPSSGPPSFAPRWSGRLGRPVPSPHGILAGHRSTAEQRAGFRAALASRYDLHTRSVTRTLAARPGMRAAGVGETDSALVTDLVAVRAYASGDGIEIDRVLRSADPSAALAAAACVASGLGRLPSVRGVVYRLAVPSVAPGRYLPGAVLTEPAFLTTILPEDEVIPAGAVFVIWSSTGRRTGSLELDGGSDNVVFAANTAFKVLAEHASAGPDGYLLLRELPVGQQGAQPGGGLDDEDMAMVERLEKVMSTRTADGGHAGPPLSYRHTFPVGCNDDGQPYGPAGLP